MLPEQVPRNENIELQSCNDKLVRRRTGASHFVSKNKKTRRFGDFLEEFQNNEAKVFSSYNQLLSSRTNNTSDSVDSCLKNYIPKFILNQSTTVLSGVNHIKNGTTHHKTTTCYQRKRSNSTILLKKKSTQESRPYYNSIQRIPCTTHQINSITSSLNTRSPLINETKQINYFSNIFILIPEDILLSIFYFLTVSDVVLYMSLTCSYIRAIAKKDYLWSIFFSRDFPNIIKTDKFIKKQTQCLPWNSLYRSYSDKFNIRRYSNESESVRQLYFEMETALHHFNSSHSKRNKSHKEQQLLNKSFTYTYSNNEIKLLLDQWQTKHPNFPPPKLQLNNSKTTNLAEHHCFNCKIEIIIPGELFICCKTGLVHICSHHNNDLCTSAIPSDTIMGGFVCPISGRVLTPKQINWNTIRRYSIQGTMMSDVYADLLCENRIKETLIDHVREGNEYEDLGYSEFIKDEDNNNLVQMTNDLCTIDSYLSQCCSQGNDCIDEIELN